MNFSSLEERKRVLPEETCTPNAKCGRRRRVHKPYAANANSGSPSSAPDNETYMKPFRKYKPETAATMMTRIGTRARTILNLTMRVTLCSAYTSAPCPKRIVRGVTVKKGTSGSIVAACPPVKSETSDAMRFIPPPCDGWPSSRDLYRTVYLSVGWRGEAIRYRAHGALQKVALTCCCNKPRAMMHRTPESLNPRLFLSCNSTRQEASIRSMRR